MDEAALAYIVEEIDEEETDVLGGEEFDAFEPSTWVDDMEDDMENDPQKLKNLRAGAKTSHTKITNKILGAIRIQASRDALRKLQRELVERYEAAVSQPDRYVVRAGLDASEKPVLSWWRELTETHQTTLAYVVEALSSRPSLAQSVKSLSSRR